MRPTQALPHLILFAMLASSSSNASVVQDACKSVADRNKDIGYAYCVKFFQCNNGSATVDMRGLAIIAAEITGAAARTTGKRIAALRASEKDKKMQECLGDCGELYSDAVDELDEAVKGIGSGKSGGLQDAVTYLSAAMDAPDTCEEGFRELGVTSPLTAEDSEFTRESSIALAVTRMLQPPRM